MKTRGLQPRVLYPASPSLKWKDKKGVPRQKKPQRIHLHETSIARYAKGTALRRQRKRKREEHKNTGEKMAMNKYLSIITLNINGLNSPIKRHRIAECIEKHDPHICCLQETSLRTKDPHRLKVKGWKKKSKQRHERKAGVAILISYIIDFKRKSIKRYKKRTLHYT